MKFCEIEDHNSVGVFYRQNGLEVSTDILKDDGAVFSIECVENGETVAAATLSHRFGVYILDYVAVDPKYRKKGLGETAVTAVKIKAKELGGNKLYITAKNPAFFSNIGFQEGSPEGVDMNADCVGCPELNNGCLKQPMYIDL